MFKCLKIILFEAGMPTGSDCADFVASNHSSQTFICIQTTQTCLTVGEDVCKCIIICHSGLAASPHHNHIFYASASFKLKHILLKGG